MPYEHVISWEYKDASVLVFVCAGHKVSRRRLQASSTDGLPRCSPHTHAGLLAEGAQWKAQVLPDCHGAGQAYPQPREPQVNGHIVQVESRQSIRSLLLQGFAQQMHSVCDRYDLLLKAHKVVVRKFSPWCLGITWLVLRKGGWKVEGGSQTPSVHFPISPSQIDVFCVK